MHRFALACFVIFGALILRPGAGHAQNLEGSWSGGGDVALNSGAEVCPLPRPLQPPVEWGYIVNAVCATPSIRAVQTASLHKIGDNRFRGTFYNREYGSSGTICVMVRGNTQSVRLTSEAGWASLKLSR
jgi:hypothetical protein